MKTRMLWPALVTLTLLPRLAVAHPLGNFTINRYAALHVEPGRIAIHYVVDMAEIPAFQEITAIDTNGNGAVDADEREAYLARVPRELAENLRLDAGGAMLPLALGARSLEMPPGAGGLPTLRIELQLGAPLDATGASVAFHDLNFAGHAGWQEIVADAHDGVALADSTVPTGDRSHALRAYPTDLLQSPPQVTEAAFRVVAVATPAMPVGVAAAPLNASLGSMRFSDRMTELIATREPLGWTVVLGSLLVAAMLGALHALSPGHGKTIVGAYLVGARGTARHAVFLGLIVTATHTLGVYVLGLATLAASRWIVPERLFPWISAASGFLVLLVGASLARTRLRAATDAHGHEHGHDHVAHDHHAHAHAQDHVHDHGHAHDGDHDGDHHHAHHQHEHAHSHVPAGDLTWRSLLALGISGGLLPCPSALVVMLGAIALGRVAFGLVLIVAFSAGLAGVLTAIGVAFVYAGHWLERLPLAARATRYVPVASAVVISLGGLFLLAQALAQLGVLRVSM